MMYKTLLYAACATGIINGCESSSLSCTKLIEKTNQCSKDTLATSSSCGAVWYTAGVLASCCTELHQTAYNPTDFTQYMAQEIKESAYPYVQECAEHAPTIGLACCIIPASLCCLSSCALKVMQTICFKATKDE